MHDCGYVRDGGQLVSSDPYTKVVWKDAMMVGVFVVEIYFGHTGRQHLL